MSARCQVQVEGQDWSRRHRKYVKCDQSWGYLVVVNFLPRGRWWISGTTWQRWLPASCPPLKEVGLGWIVTSSALANGYYRQMAAVLVLERDAWAWSSRSLRTTCLIWWIWDGVYVLKRSSRSICIYCMYILVSIFLCIRSCLLFMGNFLWEGGQWTVGTWVE